MIQKWVVYYDAFFNRKLFSDALESTKDTHVKKLLIPKETKNNEFYSWIWIKTQFTSVLYEYKSPKESKDTNLGINVVDKASDKSTSVYATNGVNWFWGN